MAGQKTFELTSPYLRMEPWDMPLADPELGKPPGAPGLSADPLVAGEFVGWDDTGTKAVRASDAGGSGIPASPVTTKVWPVYFDPGDVSVQVREAVPVLYHYDLIEVRTWVCDDTGCVVGDDLEVATLTDPLGDGVDRDGLQEHTAGRVVGYVKQVHGDGSMTVVLLP